MTVDPSVAVSQANEALQKAEAATPGPWDEQAGSIYAKGELVVELVVNAVAFSDVDEFWPTSDDAAFIAAARTDVPLLARLVLDLAEQVGVAEGVRDEAQERYAQALRRVQVTEAALDDLAAENETLDRQMRDLESDWNEREADLLRQEHENTRLRADTEAFEEALRELDEEVLPDGVETARAVVLRHRVRRARRILALLAREGTP